ncbi:CHAT domain-containing protein [Streptosporangiaceae bacterium NEAU-GS5]|nr:CHAT domain-containing protein [Streptosporangiaceae bacterium NEAU-GS5]
MAPNLVTPVASVHLSGNGGRALDVCPDARKVAGVYGDGHDVQVVSYADEARVSVRLPLPVKKIRLSPDGRHLLALVMDPQSKRRAYIFDLEDPDAGFLSAASEGIPTGVSDAAWLPDGRVHFVGHTDEGVWSRVADGAVRRFAVGPVDQVFCAGDRIIVLRTESDYQTRLVLFPDGKRLFEGYPGWATAFNDASGYITDLLIGEHGRFLAWGGRDPAVRTRTEKHLTPADAHVSSASDCLILLSGRKLAAYRVTDEDAYSLGEYRELGFDGVQLSVASGNDGIHVAVAGPEQIAVYHVTDLDILAAYAKEPEHRRAAAHRLAGQQEPQAVAALVRLTRGPDADDRSAAVTALARTGTDAALDAVLTTVAVDGTEAGHIQSAFATVPADQLAAAARRCLTGRSRAAMWGAVQALIVRPDLAATAELCATLTNPEVKIRAMALRALDARKDPRSLPALLHALADREESIAADAWRLIMTILSGDDADRLEQAPTLSSVGAYVTAVARTGSTTRGKEKEPDGAAVLEAIADVASGPGHALDDLLNALTGMGGSASVRPTAVILCLLVAERLGRREAHDEAHAFLLQAARSSGAIGEAELEWHTWAALGDLCARLSQLRAADRHYTKAEQVIDRMWAKLLGDLDDRFFFADKAALYERAQLCRLRLGHPGLAFETLEKAKTRFLGDLIARRHADPRHGLATVDESFWRAAGERRPLRVAEGGPADGGASDAWEVVGVAATGGGPDGPIPAGLAALLREENRSSMTISMVQDLWAVAARLAEDRDLPEATEKIRGAMEQLDDALEAMRAVANDYDAPGGADVRELYGEAASRLAEATYVAGGPTESGWAPSEFGTGWIGEFLSGEAGYGLLLDAMREATSYVTGRRFVAAYVDGLDEAGHARWARHITRHINGHSVISFTVARPASGEDGTEDPRLTTARTRVTHRRWEYTTRLARGETVGIHETAAMLRPRQRTALVGFAVCETMTVVYVMTSGAASTGWIGPATFFSAKVTAAELTARLMRSVGSEDFPVRLQEDEARVLADVDDTLRWLYQELFEPIRPLLEANEITKLIAVPHRGLHLLPMAAWWRPHRGRPRYVVDDYQVTVAPSLTLLDICQDRQQSRPRSGTRPLAIVDSKSNLALTHLDMIALGPRLTRDRILAGRQATFAAVADKMGDADPCHYAGHAQYNWKDPLGSELRLADTPLTLDHLFNERLSVRPGMAAALIGCETGMTDPRDAADEYLGVASGFLFAGAASIIASLWVVDDAAAAAIVAYYYQESARGAAPAAALRSAQIWIRTAGRADVMRVLNRAAESADPALRTPGLQDALEDMRQRLKQSGRGAFAHPVDWAPFVAIGIP